MKEFIKGQIFSPQLDLEKQYATYTGILKNAVEGKVVTRFPPEPSGYLHIGHVKAALLNYHYAKIYKGQMILRFDDTNPMKEKQQFVDAIIEDLQTLGIHFSKLTYTSDYFDKILEMTRKLILDGKAYVDDTPVQKMRQERMKKIESKHRTNTPEQNLAIFEKMVKGQADEFVLRAKIDMQSKNGCMRDPTLYRTCRDPHQRTGKKYTLYPTYDLACPIVDSLEGVTHTLRTNEYADRIPQYFWILEACNLPKLQIYEYSRLNLQYTVLSKRKLQWFVDHGMVEGWQDPRFPTLRGVLRKGIRVETLTEFMLQQGPSKSANLMEWQKIWAINKRIIDPICPRFSAVSVDKASVIVIVNGPKQPEAISVPNSKLNLNLGNRPMWRSSEVYIQFDDADQLVKVGQKITLMNWGNVMIHSKDLQDNGSYLMKGQYLAEDKDFKTTKKITWLAKNSDLLVADLIEYDHLIKYKKVDEEMDFDQAINHNSKFIDPCFIDGGARGLNPGQFLQFQRRGYFKIDKVTMVEGDYKYEMIYTPDGKVGRGIGSIQKKTDKQGDIKHQTLAEKINDKKQKQKPNKKNKKKEKKEGDQAQNEAEAKKEQPTKQEQPQSKKEEEKPAEQKKQQPTSDNQP